MGACPITVGENRREVSDCGGGVARVRDQDPAGAQVGYRVTLPKEQGKGGLQAQMTPSNDSSHRSDTGLSLATE